MTKLIISFTLFLFLIACNSCVEKKVEKENKVPIDNTIKLFSKAVGDTFSIFVSLPPDYNPKEDTKYAVVYLLDANLYFDIVASSLKKYSEAGMLATAILIGVGYKNFQTMDSLRNRDYTYPIALPEYEMSVSGKADKFLTFINTELVPKTDKKYLVDKTRRVLVGHSLGGLFTVYALHKNLTTKNNLFSGYIAASPSTHYNNNYILNELAKQKLDTQAQIKSYITFGGLEDEEEEDSTMLKTNQVVLSLEKSLKNKINFKGEIYSNLGHMDTPLPTFIKGLRWTLEKGM